MVSEEALRACRPHPPSHCCWELNSHHPPTVSLQQGLTQGLRLAQGAVGAAVPISFVPSPTVQYYQCSPRHPSGTARGAALASGQPGRKKLKPKTERREVVRLSQTEGLAVLIFGVIQADGAAQATGQAEVVLVITSPPSYRPVLSPTCRAFSETQKLPSDYKFTLPKGPAAPLLFSLLISPRVSHAGTSRSLCQCEVP